MEIPRSLSATPPEAPVEAKFHDVHSLVDFVVSDARQQVGHMQWEGTGSSAEFAQTMLDYVWAGVLRRLGSSVQDPPLVALVETQADEQAYLGRIPPERKITLPLYYRFWLVMPRADVSELDARAASAFVAAASGERIFAMVRAGYGRRSETTAPQPASRINWPLVSSWGADGILLHLPTR